MPEILRQSNLLRDMLDDSQICFFLTYFHLSLWPQQVLPRLPPLRGLLSRPAPGTATGRVRQLWQGRWEAGKIHFSFFPTGSYSCDLAPSEETPGDRSTDPAGKPEMEWLRWAFIVLFLVAVMTNLRTPLD